MSENRTRAGYVAGKNPDDVTSFILLMPFRVEIKSWNFANKRFYCFFNLPDEDQDGFHQSRKFVNLILDA